MLSGEGQEGDEAKDQAQSGFLGRMMLVLVMNGAHVLLAHFSIMLGVCCSSLLIFTLLCVLHHHLLMLSVLLVLYCPLRRALPSILLLFVHNLCDLHDSDHGCFLRSGAIKKGLQGFLG